jgi:hypothetical protein
VRRCRDCRAVLPPHHARRACGRCIDRAIGQLEGLLAGKLVDECESTALMIRSFAPEPLWPSWTRTFDELMRIDVRTDTH